MTQATEQLQTLLASAIDALGLDVALWGVEFTSGPSSALLRVYIDAGERLITVEDCATVSREISAMLDVEDPIPGNYTLEVSSPGMARPLFTPPQFAAHAGEIAKITLGLPLDGRRRFEGAIVRVEGVNIVLATEAGEVTVPHENIQKAKLVPDYGQPAGRVPKPGPARRKPTNPGAV